MNSWVVCPHCDNVQPLAETLIDYLGSEYQICKFCERDDGAPYVIYVNEWHCDATEAEQNDYYKRIVK